jgi:hypothetical protein
MAVTLYKAYQGYAAGATIIVPDDTQTALIAQGIGYAASGQPTQTYQATGSAVLSPTVGGNKSPQDIAGFGAPSSPQGPRILPNGPILAFASLGTSAVHVAGTWYRAEIQVPHLAQWTGIQVLNGATVGTDNLMVALYDTNGVLITNSAVAGVLSAGANAFQSIAFLTQPILTPGRYFVAVQCSGTTATTRRWAAANGGNQMTQSATGTFGTVPASFTPPTTFTADVGPIAALYQ